MGQDEIKGKVIYKAAMIEESKKGITVINRDFVTFGKVEDPTDAFEHGFAYAKPETHGRTYSLGMERTPDSLPLAEPGTQANLRVEVGETALTITRRISDTPHSHEQDDTGTRSYDSKMVYRYEDGSLSGKGFGVYINTSTGELSAMDERMWDPQGCSVSDKKLATLINTTLQEVLDTSLTREEYIKLKSAQKLVFTTIFDHASSDNSDKPLTALEEKKVADAFNEINADLKKSRGGRQ